MPSSPTSACQTPDPRTPPGGGDPPPASANPPVHPFFQPYAHLYRPPPPPPPLPPPTTPAPAPPAPAPATSSAASPPLRILTYNVQGLNDARERNIVFSWIRKTGADLVLLQETKCHSGSQRWERAWGPPAHFTTNTSPSAGVAALVTASGSGVISDVSFDTTSATPHILTTHFSWAGHHWAVHNVYAPSDAQLRPGFFENVKPTQKHEHALQVLAGDFNCVHDPALDKIGGNADRPSAGAEELAHLAAAMGTEDWWRRSHPDEVKFTWSGTGVATRIDRIYTPSCCTSWVKQVDYLTPPKSDHLAVLLTLQPPGPDAGQGLWRLKPRDLRRIESSLPSSLLPLLDRLSSSQDLPREWEQFKFTTKSTCRGLVKEKERADQDRANTLQLEVTHLTAARRLNPAQWQRLRQARADLQALERSRTQAQMERARHLRHLSARIPTASLASLYKPRHVRAHTPALKNADGLLVDTPAATNAAAVEFYANLYNLPEASPEVTAAQDEILAHWQKFLPTDLVAALDAPIALREVKDAIERQPRGKAPGIDGLPAELYQLFSEELAPILLKLYNSLLARGDLTPTQKEGVITLIFKKGDPHDVANYRPITLLGVDLKILSTILNTRLTPAAQHLLHPDQTAVKGRYIGQATRLMLDVLHRFDSQRAEGAVLLVDQLKAFDRLDHTFLFQVLERAGFPDGYLRWLRLLYHDARSRLTINGHVSEGFRVLRGVRQGDPSSPLLFALSIEAVACALRASPTIKGLAIPGSSTRVRLALYADDLAFFAADENDLREFSRIFALYERASSAKMNARKTEGIISGIPTPPKQVLDIEWLAEGTPTRYLGVSIGLKLKPAQRWQAIMDAVRQSTAKWANLHLPLSTRAVVVKHFLFPKIAYQLQVQALDKSTAASLDQLLRRYLWDSPRGKIRAEIARNARSKGGLGLPDLAHETSASRVVNLRRLVADWQQPPTAASEMSRSMVYELSADIGLGRQILHTFAPIPKYTGAPPFYHELVAAWRTQGRTTYDDLSREEVLSQPLFYHPLVPASASHATMQKMGGTGITRVRDLYKDPGWMDEDDLVDFNGWSPTSACLDDFIFSIPASWIRTLYDTPATPPQILLDGTVSDCRDFFPNRMFFGSKPLAQVLRSDIKRAPVVVDNRWPTLTVAWDRVWRHLWTTPASPQQNGTLFVLAHHAHWTGARALKHDYKLIPPDCSCGQPETEEHLFWSCTHAREAWRTTWRWFRTRARPPAFDLRNILHHPDPRFRSATRVTAHYIWVTRCTTVYDHTPRPTSTHELLGLLQTLLP